MPKCSYCNEEVRVDRCAKHFVTKHIQEWSQKNKDIRRHCLANKIPFIWEGTVKQPTLIACLVCKEGCTKSQRSNPVEWMKTHKCNTPENFEPYIEHYAEIATEDCEDIKTSTLGPEETMWRNKYIELEKHCKDEMAKSRLEASKATAALAEAKEQFEKALKPPKEDLQSKDIIIQLKKELNEMTMNFKRLQETDTNQEKYYELDSKYETIKYKLNVREELHKNTLNCIKEWIEQLGEENDTAQQMMYHYETEMFEGCKEKEQEEEEEEEDEEEEEEEKPILKIVETPKVKVIRKVTKVT